MMSARRENLRFLKLSEIADEVQRLRSKGYVKTGKWDLSQICEHLADWMTFPIDGFPKGPWIVGFLLSIIRVTQGKTLYKRIIQNQGMASNGPTDPKTVYASTSDSDSSITRLLKAIDRFEGYRGPLHPSPVFGALNYDEALALQLVHSAHHLSFLVPKE